MKNLLLAIIAITLIGGVTYFFINKKQSTVPTVSSYKECVEKGYETRGDRCIAGNQVFIEGNGNIDQEPSIDPKEISNYEECVEAGFGILESYPPQCKAGDKMFSQDIGNVLELIDIIKVDNPRPNESITSPLEVTGEARGTWYFEADFPIYLYDENGNELAQGIAQAQEEWMTEEFVPFTASLEFEDPQTKTGELILEKSNPSGLEENEESLRIPVNFK